MVIPFFRRGARRTSQPQDPRGGAADPGVPDALCDAVLREVVDAVDALIVVATPEGTLRLWNRRCEETSGVPLAEVAGKPLWDVMRLRPNQRTVAQAAFDRLVSGDEYSVSFQSQWVRRDGRKARLAWKAGLVRANGKPAHVIATGTETTRGRRVSQQLAETEARFETLMDLLPEAVVVHQDGRAVFVNRAAVRLYGGTSPEEILGMPVLERVAPESRELVRSRVLRMLGQGEWVPLVEERHLKLDGTPFDTQVAAAPVAFGGRPAVELVVRDLSVRNATEAALRESEAKMRSLLEAAPVVVWATSRDGIVTSLFGHAQEVLGQAAEDLIGHDVFQLAASLPEFREAATRALEGEARFVRIHSPGRALECRLSPVLGQDGEAAGIIGVATDVTESEVAEAARAETEARVRAVFDESLLGMMLVDREGRCLEGNRALQRLLGYDPQELRALATLDYTHPDDRAATAKAWTDLLHGVVGTFELEKRYIRRDGSEVWARVHVSPVCDADGAIRQAVVGVEDITEHRALDDRDRQASKMEALGRLAGGVAHDFNNLLTVVNGYSDLLVASLEGDERAADAMEIRRAGSRAAELTAQLLAFGRRGPRQLERVDLNGRIAAMVPMLRRLLGEDIEFEVTLDQRLGAIEADPSQFDQVVMNLVVNGRDAMPGGGELRLTTCRIDQPASPDLVGPDDVRAWARLEITDSGFGIAPEIMDRIFEPFFTTKDQGRGTGLGLATVYGIVEQMGGRIRVDSSVGMGSRFSVDLPLTEKGAEEAEVEAAVEGARASGCGNETILLVEDEPAVRDFCKRALEAEGYAVVACGPKDAIAEATRLGIGLDILVTDVVMPELDGPTIAAALSSGRQDLRVLFMSGYPRDREQEMSGPAAGGAVLGKPFSARELCDAVRRVLDRTAVLDGG